MIIAIVSPIPPEFPLGFQAMTGSSAALGAPTECRFKARVAVRLSEAGPGPAAGGPVYFRVDAWAVPWFLAHPWGKSMRKTLVFSQVFSQVFPGFFPTNITGVN